ncbi:uncharacterized protein LOC111053395 isoform X1 [Nilaparvata lugens]|uniref:uncharacterized protein LOC111053395 isoform X1 n=1 Tax=Nilaparvata lugens TaxID=108931 RepID=UPI00193D7D71|nr:uncharacterized protein LOC111053395 isoform X1 [Nilaparvata lugens]
MESSRIRSYLILDLETTGFINSKITEVSLLGVVREHIEECHAKKSPRHSKSINIPRVVQKLNVCVYPNRMINNLVSEVTGLTNDLLQPYPSFNKNTCKQIVEFIKMLPKPVCMLAHNGNRFDFPIIRGELAENGMELPDDLYCADTLQGFRALLYNTIKNADDLLEIDSDEETQFNSLLETEEIIKQEKEDMQNEERLFEVINEVEEIVESVLCKETETLMTDKYGEDVWGEQYWDSALQIASEKAEADYLKEVKGIDLSAVKSSQEVTPVKNSKKATVSQVYNAATTLKEVKRSLFADIA